MTLLFPRVSKQVFLDEEKITKRMRGNKLVKIQHLVFHSSRKCFKKIDFFLPDSNALSFSLKLKIRKSEQHRFNRSIRGGNSCKLEDRGSYERRIRLRSAPFDGYTTWPWIQLRDRGRSTWNDRRPGMNVKRGGGGGGGEKKSTGNSCHPPRRPSLCYLPSYHREKFRGGSPLGLATRLLAFRAA